MGELEEVQADVARLDAQLSERRPPGYVEGGAVNPRILKRLEKIDPGDIRKFRQWKLKMLADPKIHVIAKLKLSGSDWNLIDEYEGLLKKPSSPAVEAQKKAIKSIAVDSVERAKRELSEEFS
jgi:hypothetical protein